MAPQPEETLTSRGSGVVALQLQELTPANRVPVLYSSIQLYTCILGALAGQTYCQVTTAQLAAVLR